MGLRDRKFSREEFDKTSSCGFLPKDAGFPSDFNGTLEEALDAVKGSKTMNYWVGLWTAMQFFLPKEARRVAWTLLDRARPDTIWEGFSQGMQALSLHLSDQLDDSVLQSVHKRLSAEYQTKKQVFSKEEKLLAKSLLAAIGNEPNKSCPLVGLNLESIVTPEFVDATVRGVLRRHP